MNPQDALTPLVYTGTCFIIFFLVIWRFCTASQTYVGIDIVNTAHQPSDLNRPPLTSLKSSGPTPNLW